MISIKLQKTARRKVAHRIRGVWKLALEINNVKVTTSARKAKLGIQDSATGIVIDNGDGCTVIAAKLTQQIAYWLQSSKCSLLSSELKMYLE